jgi:hypothetical protein
MPIRKMLGRIDKSADANAMKHIYSMPISSEVVTTAKNSNEFHLSQARAWANHILDEHGSTIPEGLTKSAFTALISIPDDAGEDFVVASEFLKLETLVAMAAEQRDVEALKELTMYFGYCIFNLLARASSGTSFPYGLPKYRQRIVGNQKGGSREPVWGPVAKIAPSIFANFKRGKGVSDNAALKGTLGELTKRKRKKEFEGEVPGLTCLREHLVKKPSSGK